jgi:hypothetical protein
MKEEKMIVAVTCRFWPIWWMQKMKKCSPLIKR